MSMRLWQGCLTAALLSAFLLPASAQVPLTNVALGKTATQRSTFNGTDQYANPPLTYTASAGLAVDGASTKRYQDKTCAVTDWLNARSCTSNPWWQLSLGKSYVIHRVDIYGRAGDAKFTAQAVRVGSHEVRRQDRTVHSDLVSISLSPPVTASTVNISLSGCTILQLCEVEVFGEVPLTNVALRKRATQSSTFNGTDGRLTYAASADLAVDGAPTKLYQNKTCAVTDWSNHARCTSNPWWYLSLEKSYVIHRVDIYGRAADPDFEDQVVWVGSHKVLPQDKTVQRNGPLVSVSIPLSPPVTTSTVRISLPGCTILQLCEVEVFGAERCASSPCQNEGTCSFADNTSFCTCRPGYTGMHCETDIDDCTPNPCYFEGTCHDRVNGYSCTCRSGYRGYQCQTDINDCRPNPCQNGGTCSDGVNTFTCSCLPGYTGDRCEEDINECWSNPCQNGGTCDDGVNAFTCSCPPGYTGVRCEEDINECNSNPCENGGTCQNRVNAFACTCVPGFSGDKCQIDVDECQSSPCQNEGSCVDQTNGYSCDCGAGFTGSHCETDVDECHSNPCQNEGTCKDAVNGYSCDCVPGYTGDNCKTDIDECESSPCQNNGTCSQRLNEFVCSCLPGYMGPRCQDTCSGGRFGQDCVQSCSPHCLHKPEGTQQHCHHSTGACLRTGGCRDGYQGEMCTEPPGVNMAVVVPSVIASLVFAAVVIIAFIWYRRRKGKQGEERQGSRKRRRPQRQDVPEDAGVEEQEMESPDRDVYYNTAPASTCLSPASLPALLDKARADPDFFKEEYQRLPQGLQHPVTVALNEHNKGKNRYKGICAYDHSRVVLSTLPGLPHSDYINACYMDGYKKPKAFIAAQGPTELNVADFIRMIWEKDVEKIAMVTIPFEMGKMKCVEYYGDKGSKVFGDFTVAVESIRQKKDITIRSLSIKPSNGVAKRVTHFLFTAWPDKDVPESPWPLIDFRDKVMTSPSKGKEPILVHCSAGVGRTGTLIAMDIILRQLAAEGVLDVYSTVWSLRQQRTEMVQTLSQYTFLHEAALVGLCSAGRVVPLDIFTSDPVAKKKAKIAKEYEALQRYLTSCSAGECSLANNRENRPANRNPDIIPPDKAVVWLNQPVDGQIDYINAVYLPNYEVVKRYILTQTPLPSTVVNFWRAVLEQNVSAIVTLDTVKPDPEAAVGQYVPLDKTPVQEGPLTLTLVNTERRKGYTLRTIHVKLGQSAAPKSVQQFEINAWPQKAALPPDPSQFAALVHEVLCCTLPEEGKLLVHCREGSRRSGVFVALSTLLERSSSEAEVAVPYVVGVLASVRPQALPSKEQYAFLYAAMLSHAANNVLYQNLSCSRAAHRDRGSEDPVYSNE